MKLFFPLILFPLILFYSCSKGQGSEDTGQQDGLKNLPVAVVPTMDCLPLFIAYEGHYADSLGYILRLQHHLSLADCDMAFLSGTVFATPSDYLHVTKLQSDSTVFFANGNVILTMLLNQRARLREAKQLTDKMVACDRKGVSAVIAQHVLDSVGLKNDKTFLVNFPDLLVRRKMMETNEMDAVILPEPQSTIIAKDGNHVVYTTSSYKGKLIGCLAANKRVANVVKGIYNRACDSINTHGIHAYDSIIVKHLNVPASMLNDLPKRKFHRI